MNKKIILTLICTSLLLGCILDTIKVSEDENVLFFESFKERGIITNVNNQLTKINTYYYDDNIAYEIIDGYRAGGEWRMNQQI